MPAPKCLLIPFLFWGIAVYAETKSTDYSMEPASFPALAGESQSSDYSQFSVVEPISGLSTVQVPDQEDATGFLNLIRIPKLELRKAIVETLQPEISGRTVRLKARLLDDGGEAPDRLGFRVTYGSGSSSEVTEIAASRTGNLLTAQTNTFSPGKTYYVRAFAENQAGVRFGAIKAFKLDQSLPAPLGQATPTGNGWYRSTWFGSFLPFDNGWVYHLKLGWVYPYPDGEGGLWLWLESQGWMWTQSNLFPYLWRHQSGAWRYAIGLRAEIPIFLDWIEPTPKPGHNLPNSLVLDQYFITHKGVYVTGFERGGKLFFSDLQEDSGADYYSGSDYYYSSDYYNYSYTASGYNFITGSGLSGFIQPLDNKKFIEPRIIYVDPSGKAWQANLDDTLYEQVLTPLP